MTLTSTIFGQDKPAPTAAPGGVIWEPPQVGGGGGGGGVEGGSSLCDRSKIDALFRTADGTSYVFKGVKKCCIFILRYICVISRLTEISHALYLSNRVLSYVSELHAVLVCVG
jgi:hypothetical protein